MMAKPDMYQIDTERLRIRAFTFDDAAFVVAILNDPDWLRFIGDRNVRNLQDARRQIEEKYLASYERHGTGLMVVTLKSTGAAISMCGLIKRDGLDDVDIGFAFLPACRGQGYAHEAAQATLAYGRERFKLKRVVAITLPENTSSISLIEKIGLKFKSPVRMADDEDTLTFY